MPPLIDKRGYIEQSIGYLFEEELLEEMVKIARLRETVTDEIIIHVGDSIQMIPIVVQGSIKISRESPEGRELLLYYIEGGDTCAISLQCCMRKTEAHIKATAMEPSVLLMFPFEFMQLWMDKYTSWRTYILQSYHTRMLELMETIDEIAFMRLDERLLKYLKDQAKLLGTMELHHTHQEIADDLDSSRVVISRLLKQLEHHGRLEIHRNRITLLHL
jgi:CRP/FNR family transcriptional regulator